jgi:hypothetical protein
MSSSRTALSLVMTGLLLVGGGCKKRRPNVPVAQQPPTITQPQPQPSTPSSATADKTPVRPPESTTTASTTPPKETTPPTRSKPRPRPSNRKTVPNDAETTEVAKAEPPRRVIPDGSAEVTTPVVSARIPHDEAVHHQQNTALLLQSTESNLAGLKQPLSDKQRAMVEQIRNFMQQSQDATKTGDLLRAHNLALKAHLLSDELVKQ